MLIWNKSRLNISLTIILFNELIKKYMFSALRRLFVFLLTIAATIGAMAQDFTIAQNVTGNNRTDIRGQVFSPSQQEDGTGTITSPDIVYLSSFNVIYAGGTEASTMYIYSTLPGTTASLDDGTGGILVGESITKATGDFPYTNYSFDYLELDVNTTYYAVFRQDVQLEYGGSLSIDGPYAGGKMLTNDGANVLENDYAALKFTGELYNDPLPHQGDVDALIALYNATDGDNWTNTWDLNGDPYNWYGVTWNNGRVVGIGLDQNNLAGILPENIGNFTLLGYLSITQNQLLTGGIPIEIGNLNMLEILDLRDNNLTNSIPLELSSLTSLVQLRLANNGLEGQIPPELMNLTSLTMLDLSNNKLVGSIPQEIGLLTQLTSLMLNYNNLTGAIPIDFNKLDKLSTLYLHGNQLTGNILVNIVGLINLTYVDLSYNEFVGSIPPEIVNWNKLVNFDVSYNLLSGVVPSELTNLVNVQSIVFYGNNFNFESFESVWDYLITREIMSVSPQSNIVVEDTIIANLNSEQKLTVTTGGINNQYQWFLNGTAVSEKSSSPDYVISSVTESNLGIYHCEVTNTVVTDLVLQTEDIRLFYATGFTNSPTVIVQNAFSLKLETTVNKAGLLYYLALPEGANIPTEAQIIAGTNALDEIVVNAGNSYVSKDEVIQFTISGLDVNTSYDIYCVVVGGEGVSTVMTNLTASTIEGIAFTQGSPTTMVINATDIITNISVTRDGTIFYVTLPQGSDAPTAAQVKTGTNALDETATISGSKSTVAETVTELIISGLNDKTAYDIYLVGQDEEDLFTEVVKLQVETITGIENPFKYELKVYPNPVSGDKLHITFDKNELFDIHVTNLEGKEVLFKSNQQMNATLNIQSLKPGTYLINIRMATQSGWVRFVKE